MLGNRANQCCSNVSQVLPSLSQTNSASLAPGGNKLRSLDDQTGLQSGNMVFLNLNEDF